MFASYWLITKKMKKEWGVQSDFEEDSGVVIEDDEDQPYFKKIICRYFDNSLAI